MFSDQDQIALKDCKSYSIGKGIAIVILIIIKKFEKHSLNEV